MDGMLSQEEINALLGNVDADSTSEEAASDAVQTSSDISKAEKLTPEESDALGEISNISMGTADTRGIVCTVRGSGCFHLHIL